MYDAQLGRFMQVDPLAHKFLTMSPYVGMGNNPIMMIDPDGREFYVYGTEEERAKAFKDLQDLAGHNHSIKLSYDSETGRVSINNEGYKFGLSDGLDLINDLDGAKDIDGNELKFGYTAQETTSDNGVENSSITPRAGDGENRPTEIYVKKDDKMVTLPVVYPDGSKPKNGFHGEINVGSNATFHDSNGNQVSRARIAGHELKENLYRTRDKLNYWVSHALANIKFNGDIEKVKIHGANK